jgi:hypothetical protein
MKKLAIGCGIAALLLAALIAALIMAGPRIFNSAVGFVKNEFKVQAEQAQFERSWKPPTEEPSEQWFPEQVAGWKRIAAGPFHELPELRGTKEEDPGTAPGSGVSSGVTKEPLIKDGYGATYMLNGARIEVKAIAATGLEKEGLMSRAHAFTPAPGNGGSTSSMQRGNLLEMKFGDRERVYCRSFSQWFILMQTVDGADIKPFAESWLHTIDQQPPPAPETPGAEAQPKQP